MVKPKRLLYSSDELDLLMPFVRRFAFALLFLHAFASAQQTPPADGSARGAERATRGAGPARFAGHADGAAS